MLSQGSYCPPGRVIHYISRRSTGDGATQEEATFEVRVTAIGALGSMAMHAIMLCTTFHVETQGTMQRRNKLPLKSVSSVGALGSMAVHAIVRYIIAGQL